MNKYVFWSLLHKNTCVALNEDLSHYAQGETFWKALLNLFETLKKCEPSKNQKQSPMDQRIKMFYETGLNKVEILVNESKDCFSIKCSNSQSLIKTKNEQKAVMKYIRSRAEKSVIDPGLKKL
jgi:hypothetical protein